MAAKDGAWVLIARWMENGGWLPAIGFCTLRSTFPTRQAALDVANEAAGLATAAEWCVVPASVWAETSATAHGGAPPVRADLAAADPEVLLSDAVELCRRIWKREDEHGEIDGAILLSLTDTLSRFNEWLRANPRAARDLEGYVAIEGTAGESLPDGH